MSPKLLKGYTYNQEVIHDELQQLSRESVALTIMCVRPSLPAMASEPQKCHIALQRNDDLRGVSGRFCGIMCLFTQQVLLIFTMPIGTRSTNSSKFTGVTYLKKKEKLPQD